MKPPCPQCHSTDVDLEDEFPEDGPLVRLLAWRCQDCLRKWVTN